MYFIQKASSAKRIYARLVHAVDNSDGYTEKGLSPTRVKIFIITQTCLQNYANRSHDIRYLISSLFFSRSNISIRF